MSPPTHHHAICYCLLDLCSVNITEDPFSLAATGVNDVLWYILTSFFGLCIRYPKTKYFKNLLCDISVNVEHLEVWIHFIGLGSQPMKRQIYYCYYFDWATLNLLIVYHPFQYLKCMQQACG